MQFTSVYPQKIIGKYRNIKDASSYALVLLYLLASWLRWERPGDLPDQAIMIDLPNRKGYFFALEIWPTEVYYITSVLICAALGLFFVTSLFGRLWCGFGCPHTVFVDLFLKVEHFFQGDRNARIKLDSEPWHSAKIKAKALTHIVWMLVGFVFAFGWVCYFYDAPKLVSDIVSFAVTDGGLYWLIGLTFSTYLFAGFAREKVCTYMCPYGRFQSAMLDKDSFVVTYHDWRGEPRGKKAGAGDCIDCYKCVNVCPMGIDIRDGLQLKCIGCGLCIDACNSVMEVMKRPKDLIAFDSYNSSSAKREGKEHKWNIFKVKTLIFVAVFGIVVGLTTISLMNKPTMNVNILRDRGALYTILPDGSYRNTYTLKLLNMQSVQKNIKISVDSGVSLELLVQGYAAQYAKSIVVAMAPEEELQLEIFLKTSDHFDARQKENFAVEFVIENLDNEQVNKYKSAFVLK